MRGRERGRGVELEVGVPKRNCLKSALNPPFPSLSLSGDFNRPFLVDGGVDGGVE